MIGKLIKRTLILGLWLCATMLVCIGCGDLENSSQFSSAYSFYSSENISITSSKQSEESSYSSSSTEISSGNSSSIEESSIELSSSSSESIKDSSINSSNIDDSSQDLPHIHSYKMEVLRAPDCEREGITQYTCACGNSYLENPVALGHTSVSDPAIEATCVKHGLTEGSHCSRCEEVLVEQAQTELLPHDYQFGYCQVCNLAGLEITVDKEKGYAICVGYSCDISKVRRVEIPDTYHGYPVKELAESLFEGCRYLYSVEIGENVEFIGAGAFHECYHLVEIYDRSKAQVSKYTYPEMENGALTNYAETDDIHYEPFESEIEIVDEFVVFNDDGERVLLMYLGSDSKIFIPEGVTVLDCYCLAWQYEITEVTIPTSVTYIEKRAFYLDHYIQKIYFLDPDGWQARGHEHIYCEDDSCKREETMDWTRVDENDLGDGETGMNYIMNYYNPAEWQKIS